MAIVTFDGGKAIRAIGSIKNEILDFLKRTQSGDLVVVKHGHDKGLYMKEDRATLTKVGDLNDGVYEVVGIFDATGGLPVTSVGNATFATATNRWTLNSHGLSDGDRVQFRVVGTGAAPFAQWTDYYVRDKDTNTFKLAATPDGVEIVSAANSSGTWTIARVHNLKDEAGNDLVLPAGAIIERVFYRVTTGFTSGTSLAQLAIGIRKDDVAGIKAAAVVTNAAWTAGTKDGIQTGTAANVSEVTTADQPVEAVITVEALTGGKLKMYIRYFM